MQKELESLVGTLKAFEGVTIIASSVEPPWIHFKIEVGESFDIIISQISDLKDQHSLSLLTLNEIEAGDVSYKLSFDESKDIKTAIIVLTKKLMGLVDSTARQAKMKELGIPDLTLVTIRQMATELKQRQNLTFAIVWIESNDRDSIAIEGNGTPTALVGLLSRGTHMATEWADKNIKFYKNKDE